MSCVRDFNPREAMPLCTAFIDDMREHFGAPAGIVAREGGHEVVWGKPISRGRAVQAAPPAALLLQAARRG
jgi:hypothetical protein